jgi:VanZ family protein
MLLAGGTEWIQQYVPRRSMDIWDFVADTIGGIVAIFVSFFIKRN